MEIKRRDFLTRMLTGVVFAGTGGKALGQLIPKLTETSDPNIIQAEFVIDLSSPTYKSLTTDYLSMSITGTGLSSSNAPVIVMRTPGDVFVALENKCTHEAGRFSKFSTTSKTFTCSLHSAQFNQDGECTAGPDGGPPNLSSLTTYPVFFDKPNNKLILNRTTDIRDIKPDRFLIQCYPNPAFSDTVFHFALDKDGMTSVEIFDAQGRYIQSILKEYLAAGDQSVVFNVENLPSGSYIYKLRTQDGFVTTRTLTVVH